MIKHDEGETIVGLIIGFCIIVFVIYILIILASIIVGVAAAGGTIFGGGSAVKNYVYSFKENVIDSNREPMTVA